MIFFNPPHPLNAEALISVTLAGIYRLLRLIQSENAYSPILSMSSGIIVFSHPKTI